MTVDAGQSQGRPGELHGLEVDQRTRRSLPFEALLVHGALGGRAVEHGHHLQGQAMDNVDAAVVERQSQPCGEKTTMAEHATPPGTTQTLPGDAAATESPGGNQTAPKGLWGPGTSLFEAVSQRYASSHGNKTGWPGRDHVFQSFPTSISYGLF